MSMAMPRWCAVVCVGAALLALGGCNNTVDLKVEPGALAFGTDRSEVFFTLLNDGVFAAEWTLEEVVRESEDAAWQPADVAWFAADTAGGRLRREETARVTLTANRSLVSAGTYTNTGVRITSGKFVQVLPVSIVIESTLRVLPARVALPPGGSGARFTVFNTGNQRLSWSLRYLGTGTEPDDAVALPSDITATPVGGDVSAGEFAQVEVVWTTARTDFNLLVDSSGGQALVRIVFGEPLPGLEVTPQILTLFYSPGGEGAQPVSKLNIENTGTVSRSWTISVVDVLNPASAPAISATPNQGATLPGETTEITVRVEDPELILTGSGNYEIQIRSGEEGFLAVPLVLEIVSLPEVAISEPPNPESGRPEVTPMDVLDLGRDKVVGEFWVANIGPIGSDLFFKVVSDDDGSAAPLITSIAPRQGDTNQRPGTDFFRDTSSNTLIDGTPVYVTVDRSVMTEDVEYRTITVEAWNQDYTQRLDAVEPYELSVRVERPPLTVEGATNRSRPPYLNRFVFLLRDTTSKVIPTRSAEDLARLTFDVAEDGVYIDWNEATRSITGPETLRTNMVLLLDYSGSMYYAGTDDPVRPLAPGEAIEQVKTAALRFIDDLPPGVRLAIMYHNDRQQQDRFIFPFSTDKTALKNALSAFRLSPAMHGTSTVWDAVEEAVLRVAREDPADVLSFDDADVRAVVFLTDGRDNSSLAQGSAVSTLAQDLRVRLYPVSYAPGSPVETAEMITAAVDTGGHYYGGGNVQALNKLLGNQRSLTLDPAESASPDQAVFLVSNTGAANLTWSVAQAETKPWIVSLTPQGGIVPPGGSTRVTVTVDPALAGAPPLNSVRGVLNVDSTDGSAQVEVLMTLTADNSTLESLAATLLDEPGTILGELRNQVVLSFVTPRQAPGTYTIRVKYEQSNGETITGFFEKDGVFTSGDVRAGQLSLTSAGILEDPDAPDLATAVRAEAYLRADYVPRGVSQFRVRFIPSFPPDAPPAALAAYAATAVLDAELAPGGLLTSGDQTSSWRLVRERDQIYTLLTEQENFLPYASFGNLLRIRITGIKGYVDACEAAGVEPRILLGMRAENQIYVRPAGPGRPSESVYFLYPTGPLSPSRPLEIARYSDTASPARNMFDLFAAYLDPEAPSAWDMDEDGLPDFQDPAIDTEGLPGPLAFPAQLDLTLAPATVSLVNGRMDTFNWTAEIVPAAPVAAVLAGRFTIDFTGAVTTVAPGGSTSFTVDVDRSGLPSGLYEATLFIGTDVFQTEQVRVVFRVS
ncbi:MAG TPA: VWA domain-containing protein [Candidatus Hydrogenedentes bacterium]|nr:VWA domain-containing protein [Candidatus Hydrogenedentota bacterium]